jgi:hypothetical protein
LVIFRTLMTCKSVLFAVAVVFKSRLNDWVPVLSLKLKSRKYHYYIHEVYMRTVL